MPRIVSVWLPRWPILRFLAQQAKSPSPEPVDPTRPFVLAAEVAGGPRIAALNAAAEAEGLAVHDRLADARARAGYLQARPIDLQADAAALRRLALWATRYTPSVSPWGEDEGADGLTLDVTGASHLLGGEEALIADLGRRLEAFGLPARFAVAGTAGAAWGLSRFHASGKLALPPGEEEAALKPLPIEALRLDVATRQTLRRLGLKRVGDLIGKPRDPFAARFETALLKRLDQALGKTREPLAFLTPPPAYRSFRHLLEPVFSQEAVVAVASRLMRKLASALARDGMGARALSLTLYRVDGETSALDIEMAQATRDPAHVARLIDLRLERIASGIDAGFGFETLALEVTRAEPLDARQGEFPSAARSRAEKSERLAALVDALRQKLGPQSVRRLKPVESHLPERAVTPSSPENLLPAWPAADPARLRPLLLLPRAEPADVTASVPEGPPRRFRWRGVMRNVARAQGPERIGAEWWRNPASRRPPLTRDYYMVEDEGGRRFWLCREGIPGRETESSRWFVHGLFG
ncbi:MAG: DUF6504 family protein [Parvibaculaceae bacterium]